MLVNFQSIGRKMKAIVALLVFLGLLGLSNSSSVFGNKDVVRKARCYANCITMVSNVEHPDSGCHGDHCRQCARACEMISKSLEDCIQSCSNSTWCKTSCRYIQTTVKNWTNIYEGDGTLIPKPPVAMETIKNVTSLTLSWKPGVVNVSGSVVYLLKKRYQREAEIGDDELTMVFTEPQAVITVQDVCNNIVIDRQFYKNIYFYFTVIALTENSKLVIGDISKTIEMAKSDPVTVISTPQYTYNSLPLPDGQVILTANVTPSVSQLSLLTKIGAILEIQLICQNPAVTPQPKIFDKAGNQTLIKFKLFYKLFIGCEHTIKVYSISHCISSNQKTLVYKYPGCYNIPSFNMPKCFLFDPPPSDDSTRKVRNLTHSEIETGPDFRFRVNVTWLPPSYPYYDVTTYRLAYGDAARRNDLLPLMWYTPHVFNKFKHTWVEMKDLLPNKEYRYEVRPNIPSVAQIMIHGLAKMPGLPSDKLKVENIASRELGFSESDFYSFNVSWDKPTFRYGNVVSYVIFTKNGNETVNNTYIVVRGLQHSEDFPVQIQPKYAQSWIIGSIKAFTLHGNGSFTKHV